MDLGFRVCCLGLGGRGFRRLEDWRVAVKRTPPSRSLERFSPPSERIPKGLGIDF